MGKDDNTPKWIFAGYATTCVTGIFALSMMTGTPIALVVGVGPNIIIKIGTGVAAMGVAAMTLAAKKNNDRSK